MILYFYNNIVTVSLGGISLSINKLLDIIKELYIRFIKDEVAALSAQLTYYLLLSFFPFLIFIITILSYTPIAHNEVLSNLSNFLPMETYKMVMSIINEILATRSTSLLSIGMIATIWTASHGINAIIRGINKAYNEQESRPFWKTKGMAIFFTIALAFAILFTFVAIVLGKLLGTKLFGFLGISSVFQILWSILRYAIPLTGLVLIFTFLYRYTPNCKVKFKGVLPGAVFSTFGWIIISIGFSYYVNNFNNFTKAYGSIGGIFVLLIWLYISSIIILLGGEINATLYFKKKDETNSKYERNTSL